MCRGPHQPVVGWSLFVTCTYTLSVPALAHLHHSCTMYMSQQLGKEVERQGKQTSQLHPGQHVHSLTVYCSSNGEGTACVPLGGGCHTVFLSEV